MALPVRDLSPMTSILCRSGCSLSAVSMVSTRLVFSTTPVMLGRLRMSSGLKSFTPQKTRGTSGKSSCWKRSMKL